MKIDPVSVVNTRHVSDGAAGTSELRLNQLDDLFAARRLEMINLALVVDRHGRHEYVARHADALRSYLR